MMFLEVLYKYTILQMMKLTPQLVTLVIIGIYLSCVKNYDLKVTFKEIKQEPFNNSLVSVTNLPDSNITITILDGNNDKDYNDFNNNKKYKGDTSDYINFMYKPYYQSGSSPLNKNTFIQINSRSYIFKFDSSSLTGYLQCIGDLSEDVIDIDIFDSMPNFPDVKNNYLYDILKTIESEFIYLSFWASYCKPCIDDIYYYNANPDSINSSLLTILHFSLESDQASITPILGRINNISSFYTCRDDFMGKFNCFGFPSGILLDKKRKYIRHFNFANYQNIIDYVKNYKLGDYN